MTHLSWGNICRLHYGKPFREYRPESGEEYSVPVYGTNGLFGWANRALCDAPGVIIGRKGAYRGVHYSPVPFFVIDTAFFLELTSSDIDLKWAYYKLKTLDINSMDVGAAIPTTNRDEFYSAPVSFPPLSTQRHIADILSAYDDAIENNIRRIKLLEDTARNLYEEWFIRLRFPGHEHVRIDNGVPEGWETCKLTDLCAPKNGIQTGPFGSQLHQSDYTDEGVPVVMPKNLPTLRISERDIARIPEDFADRLSRHRLQAGDIVYGRRGDIGRRALVLAGQAGYLCGTGCLRLRPNRNCIEPAYLFHALGSPETQGAIRNRAHGSTMPNLSAKLMSPVPVIVPRQKLRTVFAEHADQTAEMVDVLDRQIAKLCAARDHLLPKLMSGEVAP